MKKYFTSLLVIITLFITFGFQDASALGGGHLCPESERITQNLRAGAYNGRYHAYTGGVVTEAHLLQRHLNRLGFSSGVEDGKLGPISTGAIKRMQAALGVTADGIVGPQTRQALNNSCEQTDSTNIISSEQGSLSLLLSGTSDGEDFDQELLDYLEEKQEESRLRSEALMQTSEDTELVRPAKLITQVFIEIYRVILHSLVAMRAQEIPTLSETELEDNHDQAQKAIEEYDNQDLEEIFEEYFGGDYELRSGQKRNIERYKEDFISLSEKYIRLEQDYHDQELSRAEFLNKADLIIEDGFEEIYDLIEYLEEEFGDKLFGEISEYDVNQEQNIERVQHAAVKAAVSQSRADIELYFLDNDQYDCNAIDYSDERYESLIKEGYEFECTTSTNNSSYTHSVKLKDDLYFCVDSRGYAGEGEEVAEPGVMCQG